MSQVNPKKAPFEAEEASLFDVKASSAGPKGSIPLTQEMLLHAPSGDLFGLSQNAGMGWDPTQVDRPQVLILSTQGGLRAPTGEPIALGYHTGHFEVGLLVERSARVLKSLGYLPFSAYVSDPCDGRTQGTVGMFDSLPYRNDAALVQRRLIRSLPVRKGVIGIATCDKGLPASMMALAGCKDLPTVLIPGGVTLPPTEGEDAGKIQTIGVRFAHDQISIEEASALGCKACASPGGGCQFLGTAATSQVVAEAMGMTVPHAALAPSGQPIWLDLANRSVNALDQMIRQNITLSHVLTQKSLENAMTVFCAVGGSTNLLIHIPAIAFSAGLDRPSVDDWKRVNRVTPRLVDALPNGPIGHPTVRVYLAGGVPEVMLHLRELKLLHLDVMTVLGERLGEILDAWERSPRRRELRDRLKKETGVDPDTVIYSPARAKAARITSTMTFPVGNIAPEGSVIKSTSIDPKVLDANGVYHKIGPARVFNTEVDAIAAVKRRDELAVKPGDIMILCCRGPLGTGMEETYQITSALRYLPEGKEIALVTDARFSGVSTGACIGHVGPEALAGGPIGKIRDGDIIEIRIDCSELEGTVNLVGTDGKVLGKEWGDRELERRAPREDLSPDPRLPADTRLWASLQQASGGTWAGCVYDVDRILAKLNGS